MMVLITTATQYALSEVGEVEWAVRAFMISTGAVMATILYAIQDYFNTLD